MSIGDRRVKRLTSLLIWFLTMVVAVIWLIPLIWMLLTSFKHESMAITLPPRWLPIPFTLENYLKVLTDSLIPRWFLNTTIVAFIVTFGVVIIDSLAAYGLARIDFKGKNLVFWVIVSGLMIPDQVLIIPLYFLFNNLNLLNSFPALILPRLALPLGVFILKQFFEGLPLELEEAAQIDGCSRLKMYWYIVMPLSKPAIAAVAVFTFIATWNAFLWPLIVANTEEMYTIPVGIANFQGVHGTEYAMLMAGSMVASLPMLVAFLFLQKQIIKGIAMSGIKG